jgi:hypothetical protein
MLKHIMKTKSSQLMTVKSVVQLESFHRNVTLSLSRHYYGTQKHSII